MRTFRRENLLYLLALLIGLAVRLVGLGKLPLSDLEAGWALQALDIVRGAKLAIGSQPAYVVLTSALFFTFGTATNTLARLVPALAGSALILVPALFREQLKPRPAVIMAFALALEPGLASISRQAGSPIMAVTFALAAWGLWNRRQVPWAGICAGMALLSGPALWVGILGLAITWAIMRPFERAELRPARARAAAAKSTSPNAWLPAGAYALGTIVLIGTLFMTVPAGLSAWLGSLPDYLAGWARSSDMPVGAMLGSLIGYQLLAVLLAVMATARGWLQGSVRVQRLSIWTLVALLLAIFYPSRQVTDLAWMIIPLLAVASIEFNRQLNVPAEDRRDVLGAVVLTVILLISVWFNFLNLQRPGMSQDQMFLGLLKSFMPLLALLISWIFVALGLSWRIARQSVVWGLIVCFGIYSLGALMAATGHRSVPNGAEMWRPGGELPMADVVLQTVDDHSAWSNRDRHSQPIVLAGVQSPALQWLLRDRPVEVRQAAGAASQPPMVITPGQEDPDLVAAYRGQSFVWRSKPVWRLLNFVDWLPFHEAVHENETLILWVRSDLFPGSNAASAP